MNVTLAEVVNRHGVGVDAHHNLDALVPVFSGPQRQGDVLIIPDRAGDAATIPVPQIGVPVVRGENGGNTHLLLAEGEVRYAPPAAHSNDLCLGYLSVPPGAVAYLAHPQHGYMGIGPGGYELRRQRQQADVIRMVAD